MAETCEPMGYEFCPSELCSSSGAELAFPYETLRVGVAVSEGFFALFAGVTVSRVVELVLACESNLVSRVPDGLLGLAF